MDPISLVRYPFDPEGGNHEPTEHYTIDKPIEFLLPRGGCFFGNSLQIVEADTLNPLKLEGDYQLGNFNQEASMEVGAGIWRSIFFDRPPEKDLLLDIRYLGGKHSVDVYGTAELIQRIQASGRRVTWDEIIKPENGIPVGDHSHHVDDLKGVQGMTAAILELAEAVRERGYINPSSVTKPSQTQWHEITESRVTLTSVEFESQMVLLSGIVGDTEIVVSKGITEGKQVTIVANSGGETTLTFADEIIVYGSHKRIFKDEYVTLTRLDTNLFLITVAPI